MNENFFDLLNNSSDCFWEVNSKGEITYINDAVEKILGYSKEELLESSPFFLMSLKSKRKFLLLSKKLLNNPKKLTDLKFSFYTKNKELIEVEVNALPTFENNKLLSYKGISKNITKDKIKRKYEFLSNILDHIPVPLFYKDKDGLYLGVNKSWEEITGIKKETVINKSVFDIASNDIANIYHKQDKKVFDLLENPQIYESEVYNKQKNIRYKVVFNKSALFDEKGNVSGLIGTIIDLSEITKLEEENKRTEKMMYNQAKLAAMGEMIGNIAHQWRQPLSAITTAATGARMQKELGFLTDSLLESTFDSICKSAKYLSQTIDDFRSFYNPSNTKIEEFYIENTLTKTLNILNAQFSIKNIQTIKNIENIKLYSIENELIQVLINILNNAKDALSKIKSEEKYIFIDVYKKDAHLIIDIKDNANGIKENIIDRIFEPYFTTKHKAQGTGIGLYMSDEIVKRHLHGRITVVNKTFAYENKTFTGANFIIKIPTGLD